ncbi:MAG: alpha/beta hydrolase [Polyangiaceae bacterium]|nr:alpha/beta hydrolase [Polyangiaceae bacterium]
MQPSDLPRHEEPPGSARQESRAEGDLHGKVPGAHPAADAARSTAACGTLVDREEDLLLPPRGMFVTIHHASDSCMSGGGHVVIFVPPLFEEMPRTRKVLVNLSRDLAAAGMTAVRFDYRGTGLSQGRFEEVTFTTMREDLTTVIDFCRSRGAQCTSLLGFRLGGYLAAELREAVFVPHLVLWEPVLDPGAFIKQMLRLEVANQMVTVGEVRFDQQTLIARFEAGENVLIDGYRVNPELYRDLAGAHALSLADLSNARDKLRLLLWRTRKLHSDALSLGLAAELVGDVRFSWSDIRFLQPRHPDLFVRSVAALNEGLSVSGSRP